MDFSKHMGFKKIGIKQLSHQAMSKLRRGLPARVMAGEGMQIAVMPHQFDLMSRAFIKNKGINLSLSSPEVEANAIEGEGIFGKKVDKFMEKKGIKKAVYSVGTALKPLAMEAIDAAAMAATAYGVPAPLVALAQKETKGYIDNPDEYQTKKGQNALLKRVGSTATEVASPYLEEAGIDVKQVKDAAKLARDVKKMSKSTGPPMTKASLKGDAEEAFLSTLQAYMDSRAPSAPAPQAQRASTAPAQMQSSSPYDLMDRDGIIGNGLKESLRKMGKKYATQGMETAPQLGGMGLYAGSSGRGLGMGMMGMGIQSSLRDMGKRYVNQSRSIVGMGHPGLESQPNDANFLSRNQMPPAWQKPR